MIEIYRQIEEELVKVFSTAIGLLVSLIFGQDLFLLISSSDMGWLISFAIEFFSKTSIAVFSGVITYLAIYATKKILKHKADPKE